MFIRKREFELPTSYINMQQHASKTYAKLVVTCTKIGDAA